MASTTHDALVATQFGPRARAYVESADHAKGADLDRLAIVMAARRPERVLDLGCGGGHVSFAVAPFAGEVVAYDLSEEMLAAVRTEAAARKLTTIRTRQGRAESLPFESESFDAVCTRYSAHHWGDLAAALAEMRRVLRPGGLAVAMDVVSLGPSLHDTFLQAIEILRDPSHVRDYSPDEWMDAMRRAGLRPASPILSRLKLDFATWVARIGTPDVQVRAIRGLMGQMPPEVVERFEIRPDGGFTLDTMTIEAEI